jgi:hypothetical protein
VGFIGSMWVSCGFHGFHRFHVGFVWVSCGFHVGFRFVGFMWVLCGFHRFYVGFMGFYLKEMGQLPGNMAVYRQNSDSASLSISMGVGKHDKA